MHKDLLRIKLDFFSGNPVAREQTEEWIDSFNLQFIDDILFVAYLLDEASRYEDEERIVRLEARIVELTALVRDVFVLDEVWHSITEGSDADKAVREREVQLIKLVTLEYIPDWFVVGLEGYDLECPEISDAFKQKVDQLRTELED